MFEYYKKVLSNYANFNGRARRAEYWYFMLCNVLIGGTLLFLGEFLDISFALLGLYCLAMFIPWLAVLVRRLHDTGRSGWHFFIYFVPFIGGIWMLVLMCTVGDYGLNAYGANPKQETGPDRFDFENSKFAG